MLRKYLFKESAAPASVVVGPSLLSVVVFLYLSLSVVQVVETARQPEPQQLEQQQQQQLEQQQHRHLRPRNDYVEIGDSIDDRTKIFLKRHTPKNCNVEDFQLPKAFWNVYNSIQFPPFVTPEIFALNAGLADGWTPGFSDTETPIVARLTHLIDTINWNCAAIYSSTWLDGVTKGEPLLRTPISYTTNKNNQWFSRTKFEFHSSSSRLICMIHAWSDVVNDWNPKSKKTLKHVFEKVFEFPRIGFNNNNKKKTKWFDYYMTTIIDDDTGHYIDTAITEKDGFYEQLSLRCYKPKVIGQIVAKQLMEYARHDGFNADGDRRHDGTKCVHNRHRYMDPTGYQPAFPSPKNKFRWQPMLEDNGRGYYTKQQFVTPHIGQTAKRAILNDMEYDNRFLPSSTNNELYYDTESYLVADRLKQTATSDMKKVMIEYYNNKLNVIFHVIGSVLSYGTSFEQLVNYAWGLTASEYDSILVAWKEKVAHDLVRPTTWIQEQMGGVEFETYGGPYERVRTIVGKDFDSFVRLMPHSEYPSGSACICQSMAQYTDRWMDLTHGELLGKSRFNAHNPGQSIAVPIATDQTGRGPPFLQGSSSTEKYVTPKKDITLIASSLTELRDQCGQSRLDGGMHFTRSVTDAYILCDGIGTIGATYSLELLGRGGWKDTIEVPTPDDSVPPFKQPPPLAPNGTDPIWWFGVTNLFPSNDDDGDDLVVAVAGYEDDDYRASRTTNYRLQSIDDDQN